MFSLLLIKVGGWQVDCLYMKINLCSASSFSALKSIHFISLRVFLFRGPHKYWYCSLSIWHQNYFGRKSRSNPSEQGGKKTPHAWLMCRQSLKRAFVSFGLHVIFHLCPVGVQEWFKNFQQFFFLKLWNHQICWTSENICKVQFALKLDNLFPKK